MKKFDIPYIKSCTYPQLQELSEALRQEILSDVAANGGHLASNLGMVEATIAIHRVFDSPRDSIIFDVGHQSYAHKLLTGRSDAMERLRHMDGASGFTSPGESEHDKTYAGHAGPSLSTALGLASSKALRGDKSYVVAVLGDGALTNGMAYEALNNCANRNAHLIIIINDNEMSISKNVGGMSRFLENTRTSRSYFNLKHSTEKLLLSIPVVGRRAAWNVRQMKNSLRRLLVSDNMFESLGVDYLGPVDGHDIQKLETVLQEAKFKDNCCVVHIRTRKGAGYPPAELHPEQYHGVGSFDLERGIRSSGVQSFSGVFGALMCKEAERNSSLCAITAAMCDGTGLGEFSMKYPKRFFDVGIAEEHAVAFAGGLALDGQYPVCALYSTFSQRVFDQVFHDVALQRAKVMFALDRSGLVPGDGVTHQGIFDVGLFSAIPGMTIYSPETFEELGQVFRHCVKERELCALRYPRGGEMECDRDRFISSESGALSYCDFNKKPDEEKCAITLVTYGRICANAVKAAQILSGKRSVRIIKLIRIFPLPEDELLELLGSLELLYILEEGAETGGIAEKLCSVLSRRGISLPKICVRAIKNSFLPQGELNDLMKLCGFSPEQIASEISSI